VVTVYVTQRFDLTGTQRSWPSDLIALWRECLTSALTDGRYWLSPPYRGLPELRELLADKLGVALDRVCVTTGVRAAARAALGPARAVRVETPTFAGLPELLQQQGLTLHYGPWSVLLEADYADGEAAWLTSPARNPDGANLNAGEWERIAGLVRGGARIIVNDSYRWITGSTSAVIEELVTVGTFAKLLGMGARCGYLLSSDEPRQLDRIMCPPTGWQLAWSRFLARGGLTAAEATLGEPQRRVSAMLTGYLTSRGLAGPGHAGVSWLLPLSPDISEDTAVAQAAAVGVTVAPGRAFLAQTPAVRISLSSIDPDEVPYVLELLDPLIDVWRGGNSCAS
jgi:DNA-binding transcriptional MocR family regulator